MLNRIGRPAAEELCGEEAGNDERESVEPELNSSLVGSRRMKRVTQTYVYALRYLREDVVWLDVCFASSKRPLDSSLTVSCMLPANSPSSYASH